MIELEQVFITFAVISMLCSGSVLLTVILFPEMKKRLFMKLIIYISFCDFMSSLVSSFGYPVDHTLLCQSQSFFAVYFFVGSWLWTTMLAHQLYSVANSARFGLRKRYMHVICWTIPLLSSLLPLSTNRYGRDDDQGDPTSWCYLAGDPTTSANWNIITFIVPLFVCVLLMLFFSCRTVWLYYSLGLNRPDLYETVHALMLYPLGMIVSWGPNLTFILYILGNSGPHTPQYAFTASVVSILCTQNGTITALIFFYKSKEARYRWWWLVSKWFLGRESVSEPNASSRINDSSVIEDKVPFDFEENGLYDLGDGRDDISHGAKSTSMKRSNVSLNSVLQLMFGEGEKIAELGSPVSLEGEGGESASHRASPHEPLLSHVRQQSEASSSGTGWDLYPET